MDAKEQLDRHVDETYGQEVFCMCPVGHEGDVLGTEMLGDEAEFYECPECHARTRFYADPKKTITMLKCTACGVLGAIEGNLISLPIVRCILSEQRVLERIKERLAPDYDNEQELADEVLSEYCQNTTGGYYGPETPIFIDEFIKE